MTGSPPANAMKSLADDASGPVLTGSQDFRTRPRYRLCPIQHSFETTIVVEERYDPPERTKNVEPHSLMTYSPTGKMQFRPLSI
jgi:hypothetical protein